MPPDHPDGPSQTVGKAPLTCDNRNAAPRWWNTRRPLTHPSDYGREGLEVNSTQEQWRPVSDAEATHEVSSHGRLRSLPRPGARGGLMAGSIDHSGQVLVTIRRPGRSRVVGLRDVVAEAFLPHRPHPTATITHRNGDRTDNRAGNLLWAWRTDEERLIEGVALDGECWRWTGAKRRTGWGAGYGIITVNGHGTSVHRFAHETWIGPIPEGYDVDHLCGVRDCINPAHLEAVTPAENKHRAHVSNGLNCRCEVSA